MSVLCFIWTSVPNFLSLHSGHWQNNTLPHFQGPSVPTGWHIVPVPHCHNRFTFTLNVEAVNTSETLPTLPFTRRDYPQWELTSINFSIRSVIIVPHHITYLIHCREVTHSHFNPLKPELNPICYLLALLGAHHFLQVSRIRVKLLTLRRLMSRIYGAPILDVSRSHTTTQHSR